MADTEKQFEGFLKNIKLGNDQLSPMRTSRDAIRGKIKRYWSETLQRTEPSFEEQGSYEMRTGVLPAGLGEYDLDDGLYLQCIGIDPATWPKTDTVQGWIYAAVQNHTASLPQRRRRCLRVPYKQGYHIDMPVYGIDSQGKVRLYEKGKDPVNFVESNPTDFAKWFNSQKTTRPNLRTVVRYFKAWRDRQDIKRLKGVTITVLVAKCFKSDDRIDKTVADTASACADYLELYKSLYEPLAPFENLTDQWTNDDFEAIVAELRALSERGNAAIAEENLRKSALIWQKEFGLRFPVPEEDQGGGSEKAMKFPAPAVVGNGNNA